MKSYYSREEIEERIRVLLHNNIDQLYNDDCIKYNSFTTKDADGHQEPTSEVISKILLDNIGQLERIKMIKRELPYFTKTHANRPIPTSNRGEERIAIIIHHKSQDGTLSHELTSKIGNVLDYQVPLNKNKSDHAGKIDLLSIRGKDVLVLELKRPDSPESMLRCVLEAYTYSKTVDKDKLLSDFQLPEDSQVIPCPLVFYGHVQYNQYMDHLHYPNLRKLMEKLGVRPIFISEEEYE